MSSPSDVQKVAGPSVEPAGGEGTNQPAEAQPVADPLAIPPEGWEPHDPKVHQFDCEARHLHKAPTCCAPSCWCVADSVARARSRIKKARQTLPEAPDFYDVVRHTNEAPRKKKRTTRERKFISGADLRSAIVGALSRCKKESDFALVEVLLREGLAEARDAHQTAKTMAEKLDGLPPYMSTKEVAAFLGVQVPAVHQWRLAKARVGGPPFERLHHSNVRYRTEDVIAWTKTHVKVGKTWRSLEEVAKRKLTEEKPRREGLLTIAQAADYLGVSVAMMHTWRKQKTGPPFVKLHPKLFAYRREDLDAYRCWP